MDPARRTAELGVGVGIGVLGVLAFAVTAGVVVTFDAPLVSDPITLPSFTTPLEAVASLALGLSFATPLLAAAGAFSVMATDCGDLGTVAAGFLPGGLVYGAGFGALYWVAFMHTQVPLVPWVREGLWLGVVFAGSGALGALAGDLVAGRGRRAIGSNHVPR